MGLRPVRRTQPSIVEQVRIVAEAAKHRADVLVIECMAVHFGDAMGLREENLELHHWSHNQCQGGSS